MCIRDRSRELEFIIEKAGVSVALSDIELQDDIREASEKTGRIQHLYYFSKMGENYNNSTLDKLCEGKSSSFENILTAADDIALIAFTSGTTGNPKGTVHYHRDILAITDCFPRYVGKISPDDVITGTPPLAFTFGLGGVTLLSLIHI